MIYFISIIKRLQVTLAEQEEISISDQVPDHEVITRRQQFRMKKDRAEKKKAKKEHKKVEKERIAKKKLEVAARKAEKASRGQNAKNKAQARQKRGRPCKSKDEVPESDDLAVAPQVRSRQMKRLKSFSSQKSPSQLPSEVTGSKRKGKQAKKPKASEKQDVQEVCMEKESGKITLAEEKDEAKEVNNLPTDEAEGNHAKDGQGRKKSGKKSPDNGKCAAKNASTTKSGKSPKKSSKSPKKGKSPVKHAKMTAAKSMAKGKAKPKKELPQASQKDKPVAKKKACSRKRSAESEEKKPEKPQRAKSTAKAAVPVDPQIKNEVAQILKQCAESHCTHPNHKQAEKHPSIGIETYWERQACGIKCDRKFFKNRKAQGSGRAHVAYFSGKSQCPYTNLKLADLWVSKLQLSKGPIGLF